MRMILLLVLLCLPGVTQAAEHTIEVSFSFDAAAATGTVVGYRLYGNDQLLCEVPVADVTVNGPEMAIECTFNWLQRNYGFELAAYYDDATESPRSFPFLFSIKRNGLIRVGGALLRVRADT